MEATEYAFAALRTRTDLGRNDNRTHALMGMVTEAGEVVDIAKRKFAYGKPVDTVNLLEEIGDYLWYVAVLCDAVDHDYAAIVHAASTSFEEIKEDQRVWSLTEVSLGLSTVTPGILEGTRDVEESIGISIVFCLYALDLYDMTIEQAQAANIAKLTARYPEKFTNDLALNRDLTAERGALEGANDR